MLLKPLKGIGGTIGFRRTYPLQVREAFAGIFEMLCN